MQKVLSYSDLSTTMVYIHIFDEKMETALKSFRQATAVTQIPATTAKSTDRELQLLGKELVSPHVQTLLFHQRKGFDSSSA